jgi:hypothetical protein
VTQEELDEAVISDTRTVGTKTKCKNVCTGTWSVQNIKNILLTNTHKTRQHDSLYLLEMRFLHVEVLECNLYDLVATRDEGIEKTVDVVLVRVRVVRAVK